MRTTYTVEVGCGNEIVLEKVEAHGEVSILLHVGADSFRLSVREASELERALAAATIGETGI